MLLDQKVAVAGLWVGHRIAEGRAGFRELGWPTPKAQVPQDFFDHQGLFNECNETHFVLAFGAWQWIAVPRLGSFRGGGGVLFGYAMPGDVSFFR